MGKHSLKKNTTPRNAAMIGAVGVGAAMVSPAVAQAAPVTHTATGVTVEVPNEIMPHVQPHLAQFGLVEGAAGSAPAAAPAAPVKSVGQAIADIALSKVGSPYSWGAAGPNAFDCSGLTSWAYS